MSFVHQFNQDRCQLKAYPPPFHRRGCVRHVHLSPEECRLLDGREEIYAQMKKVAACRVKEGFWPWSDRVEWELHSQDSMLMCELAQKVVDPYDMDSLANVESRSALAAALDGIAHVTRMLSTKVTNREAQLCYQYEVAKEMLLALAPGVERVPS